jgi:hypothetical protein
VFWGARIPITTKIRIEAVSTIENILKNRVTLLPVLDKQANQGLLFLPDQNLWFAVINNKHLRLPILPNRYVHPS